MSVPAEKHVEFERETETAHVHSVKRHANGDWVTYVVVRCRVFLPDGRTVYGSHIVPIQCRQIGRKPNGSKA